MSGDATRRAVPWMSGRGSRSGRPPASPPPAPPAAPRDLLELPLRANPAFRLVLFDRLPAGQRRQLAGIASDPEHYGVLRPRRGTGLGLKAVDRETALLFLTLARPAPLPGYVRSRLGDAGAALALARLVADGVLEIERPPAGFVSGAAAMSLFAAPAAAGGRLAELSRAALRHGQELARTLREPEPLHLSLRLYGYNRLPMTPRWRRTLPDAAAVRRHLGIAGGGRWQPLLERHWREQPSAGDEPWLRWQRRRPASARGMPSPAAAATFWRDAPTYKLYVSPAPSALPEAFGAVLDGLAAEGAPGFKVGAGAGGLLRPDKIVAYFETFERLAAAAGALTERLAGVAPHGVPFTSEIAGGGQLSWGVDPPAAAGFWPLGGDSRMSWRLWLTNRLARALIAAVAAPSAAPPLPGAAAAALAGAAAGETMEPWRFAVERLRLEGIDTDSWTPGGSLWRRQGDGA
ncbi:MAG TPA: hypothetical protein VHB47_12735 [Thermoanaerobaculia bacterium]|jgi:hypothetical protein|nr:hypothetical protein [Thermoanaerobaculia bacterium]